MTFLFAIIIWMLTFLSYVLEGRWVCSNWNIGKIKVVVACEIQII